MQDRWWKSRWFKSKICSMLFAAYIAVEQEVIVTVIMIPFSIFTRFWSGTPERGCIAGHCPPWPLEGGATEAQVLLHTSTIRNVMIYQDHIEANLLQLFARTKTSEWFSTISVIRLEVNIVAKHVNGKRITIMSMGVLLHWTQANCFELVVRQSHGRPQGRQNRGESRRGDW